MSVAVKRIELQALAQSKLDDSLLLLTNSRFSNAYYLAGYAVELGLKACIAKQFVADAIPDLQLVKDTHTHKLDQLIGTAGLRIELLKEQKSDKLFNEYWGIAVRWSSDSRYDSTDKMLAQYLMTAIADDKHGVMRWIKSYW